MIRVVHVVYSLEPGGMENGVVNLSNALDPARFQTSILCLRRRGAFADRLAAQVPATTLGLPDRFSPLGILRLALALRRLQPEVIHTHNLGPLLYTSVARRLTGGRARLVHAEHSALAAADLEPRRLDQRRRCYRNAWCVHTVSHALVDDLRTHGLAHPRFRAIVNGVDTSRFHPDSEAGTRARSRLGIPQDARVVGMVGRFGPFKRHDLLLDAFRSTGADSPGTHLLLVGGGGPLESEIGRRIADHPHSDRIHAAGFQSDPAPFYNAMDLLVVPSVNEGLSNALLEAMACGVPVLTHPACGAREVVREGEGGWVTPLDTPADLAGALTRFLSDPSGWKAMGTRARAGVLHRFSMESMVSGYDLMYSEAVHAA